MFSEGTLHQQGPGSRQAGRHTGWLRPGLPVLAIEGVPGSVLEFLSRGVPCLISDIPPMRSLTHLPGVVSLPLAQGAAIIGDTLRGLLALPDRLRSLKAAACASKLAGWQEQAQCIGCWCRA